MKSLKKEIEGEWKRLDFRLLIWAAFFVVFFLFIPIREKIFPPANFISLLALIFWTFSFIFFITKNWNKSNFFTKAYQIYAFLISAIFAFLYLLVVTKLLVIAITAFVFSIGAIFVITAIYGLLLMYGTKGKLMGLIPAYIYMAFVSIVAFGYFFSLFSSTQLLGQNAITNIHGENAKSIWEYIYFSSSTFYSTTYGNYSPSGSANLILSQIEAGISAIIHVLILGDLVSRGLAVKKT